MEQYKQEFIDFMVESDVLKFDLESIMQRLFMKHMVMILMCCSDQHIREFQSA